MKKILLVLISFLSFMVNVYATENIEISSVDNAMDVMKELYTDKYKIGDYYLIPQNSEVNLTDVYNAIVSRYRSPIDKNTYKYNEYGEIHFDKFYASLLDGMIHVNNYNKIITDKESKEAKEVASKLVNKLKDLTEYEKVYSIYKYLSNNVAYPKDYASNLMLDSYMSIYDTLVTHIGDCVAKAITFQYLAEQLGIESYIVDRVTSANAQEKQYSTNHSYNIVKLEDKWFIVDIFDKGSLDGLLIGKKNSYLNDTYNGIEVSDEDYIKPTNVTEVNFDLDKKEETKSSTDNEWILLGTILVALLFVILFFTKRK